jgi:hypothetical protein
LTCKAFLFISRRTLFEAVEFFCSSDSRFVGLIRSSPELGAAFKRLVLSFPHITTAPLIPNAGANLGRGLPNVMDLRIRFMHWGTVDAESRSALLSGFQAVERLDLIYLKFQFSHDAVGLISSSPRLADLHIEGNVWKFVVPRPCYLPLSVNLTTVAIPANRSGVFAELLGMELHLWVQSLSLEFVNDDHNYDVTSLLKTLGDDLRELVFNCMAMYAGKRALRSAMGEHTLESSLYMYSICTQASTSAITPNSATSRMVSGCQTLAVRCATFFRKSSRRSWSK